MAGSGPPGDAMEDFGEGRDTSASRMTKLSEV